MLSSKFHKLTRTAILGSALLAAHAGYPAMAEDLTVQDTSGFTRAASQVDGSSNVDFNLVDKSGNPADGVVVTLTNSATGESLTATSVNGSVTFPGVTPGVWTVSTTSPGVTFTNVVVASAIATGSTLTAATVLPALAIIGGGAGIAIAIDNNNSSSGDEISPAS
ncbi:MAG: carboxypeptidase regulatory-like domain-containing protein [Deltaproteobacteria bacterium]|nr:carboxypeptidase regulatory-like domain-containing protein [Deltaproteobacteria bacterium]